MPSYSLTYQPLQGGSEVSTVLRADNAREAFRKLPAFATARITNGWRRRAGKVSGEAYKEYWERIRK